MKQKIKIDVLKKAPYFGVRVLKDLSGGVKDQSNYSNIKRWLKDGTLVGLKKGTYVTSYYIERLDSKSLGVYLEYIANILMPQSYVSGEYILQTYNMLSENVYGITSVTLKKPQIYRNSLSIFTFSKIKEALFLGYNMEDSMGYTIARATKVKALFDFIYFRTYRQSNLSLELLRSYRLNLDELNDGDFAEFERYCKLAGQRKYLELPAKLKFL